MPRKLGDILLNITVTLVTIAALIAVGFRIKSSYSADERNAGVEPVRVKDWQTYATAGERIGPARAPVTVTIFSDFQCPYCRELAADLRAIRKEHPGEMTVFYRHFPLRIHANARAAAFASICAAQQGVFERMHDELFLHQDSIGRADWSWFTKNSHVPNPDALASCMADSVRLFPRLQRDSAAGARLGVEGTPTFLLNDLKISGSPGPKRLEEYFAAAWNASK